MLAHARQLRLLTLGAAALVIAGCGAPSPLRPASPLIRPSSAAISTTSQIQFTVPDAATPITWALDGGDQAGPGTITASGLYTPPAALFHDSATVTVRAASNGQPVATSTVILTPGFLQPATPQNSALTPGSSLTLTTVLAEIGSGTTHWSLSSSPTSPGALPSTYGTITNANCQAASHAYTVCTATFTAPATLPASESLPVYAIATVAGTSTSQAAQLLLNPRINSSPLANQSIQAATPIQLGTSGGNATHYDSVPDGAASDDSAEARISDCCGGTLGALLKDASGNHYILSTRHVLAASGTGSEGDTIIQPGLIDTACEASQALATGVLAYSSRANSNTDAALALVNAPGEGTAPVDPTGSILHFGTVGSASRDNTLSAAPPAAGTGEAVTPAGIPPRVAKSGRSTGLTCSAIDAIDVDIDVDYYSDCAASRFSETRTFRNQLLIAGGSFSDVSGDSGSLLVDQRNAQPVGLLFASGSDSTTGLGFTLANPVGDVLHDLESAARSSDKSASQLRFVGGPEHPVACIDFEQNTRIPRTAQPSGALAELSPSLFNTANHTTTGAPLVNPQAGILGLASGHSLDQPGEPAILVFADRSLTGRSTAIPQTLAGLRTVLIHTDAASVSAGTAAALSAEPQAGIQLSPPVLAHAIAVKNSAAQSLMHGDHADPAILGIGVAQSYDNPAEAALLVLIDSSQTPRATPPILDSLRVRYLFTSRVRTTGSRRLSSQAPSACSTRSLHLSAHKPLF